MAKIELRPDQFGTPDLDAKSKDMQRDTIIKAQDIARKQLDIHRVACKVSGGSLPDGYSVTLNVALDFSAVSATQERAWASRTCIINLQRNLRTMGTRELEKLAKIQYTISALDCGKKVVSREDKIMKYTAMGLTPEVATLAVDNPEQFNKLMGDVKVG